MKKAIETSIELINKELFRLSSEIGTLRTTYNSAKHRCELLESESKRLQKTKEEILEEMKNESKQ